MSDNVVDIRIEKITPSKKYVPVFCTKGSGMPGTNKDDDINPILELLDTIACAEDEIAMSDILPLVDEIMATRFFQSYINRRFESELVRNT